MKYTVRAIILILLLTWLCACNSSKPEYDASGYFETDEVIVSAQQNGELLAFSITEGDRLNAGAVIGQIDVSIPELQKEQVEASMAALKSKTHSTAPQTNLLNRQIAAQETQLKQLRHEQQRTQNLVKADAATQKQLDDINAQIDQLEKQVAVTRSQLSLNTSNTETQNRGILSEQNPLEKNAEQLQVQIGRGKITNPVQGIVLAKYALKGEMAAIGKPLYKIGNTDTLTLRAYIGGTELGAVKTGQQVKVRIDQGRKEYKAYTGKVVWIADKSEFTPKTIQTKDERANLVYAMKVRVVNDGLLKIGMYGEVIFGQ